MVFSGRKAGAGLLDMEEVMSGPHIGGLIRIMEVKGHLAWGRLEYGGEVVIPKVFVGPSARRIMEEGHAVKPPQGKGFLLHPGDVLAALVDPVIPPGKHCPEAVSWIWKRHESRNNRRRA